MEGKGKYISKVSVLPTHNFVALGSNIPVQICILNVSNLKICNLTQANQNGKG